jgi:hypothetical protein
VSEYQRLVSYIYLYDKGIKIKNSGFAKIECKDDVLRIKINIKGAFNSNDPWSVYLLTEGNYEMLGIYVGEIKAKGASAEFQLLGSSNTIGETTKSFDDLKGLAVISKASKKYATFWKDTDITIENFKEYVEEVTYKKNTSFEKRSKESKDIYKNEYLKAMAMESKEENKIKNEEKEAKKESKENRNEDNYKIRNDKINKEIQEDINQAENSNENNMHDKNMQKVNMQKINMQKENMQKVNMQKENIEKNIREENIREENIREENIREENIREENIREESIREENLSDSWNNFLTQFNRINPFSDKDEIECIRIELKDLRILPKSQWILCSNSFILHGYYNYQYLILGKVKDKFIIGVPGVFCNKEKLVAGIFGFNEFKPAQVSEYKTGRFGYWYKYL